MRYVALQLSPVEVTGAGKPEESDSEPDLEPPKLELCDDAELDVEAPDPEPCDGTELDPEESAALQL